MRFSSGPIPLYREFVEVSSCEIFRPYAHRLRRYSVAKSKFSPRNRIFRRKSRTARSFDLGSENGWNLSESPTNYLSNAKIGSKIGQAVPELLPENVTDFHEKCVKSLSNRFSWLRFLSFCRQTFRKHGSRICACKLSAKTYLTFYFICYFYD